MRQDNQTGLRIAPREAPVTGYRFGKGVYFADMFSKSVNYCYANSGSNDGVLLLCEVILSFFFGIEHKLSFYVFLMLLLLGCFGRRE